MKIPRARESFPRKRYGLFLELSKTSRHLKKFLNFSFFILKLPSALSSHRSSYSIISVFSRYLPYLPPAFIIASIFFKGVPAAIPLPEVNI